jgi:hypothetical protein
MRKLLLAATAMMGATMALANIASAQVAPPAVVVTPPPSPYAALPSQVALPGTAVVRLNVRIFADVMVGSDSSSGYKNPTTGVAAKAQPYYFGEFARIYPGFDGQTPNGIKYGASAEIRQNSGGTGSNQASNNIAGSGGNTLFWRRETAYVGTAQLGTLRFGQTDQAASLMMVGTFENFDTEGGWNGDLPGLFAPAAEINWVFPEDGTWYTTSKFVYLSPNFAGFDFGASFEPASNQTSGDSTCAGTGGNNAIGLGCATVSSISGPYATISSDLARRRNMFDIIGRYRGAFGPVGLVAEGGYIGSGKVNDANTAVDPVSYRGFSIGDAGLVVTFGGLAAGGHVDFGQVNGTGLLQKGGKDEIAWIAGASYAFGPFIVGASFLNEQYQGAWNGNAATGAKNTYGLRQEHGLSVGGTFDWAPGISLYTDYLYGTRQQAGYDFYAGTAGKTNNKTKAQGLAVGTIFRW